MKTITIQISKEQEEEIKRATYLKKATGNFMPESYVVDRLLIAVLMGIDALDEPVLLMSSGDFGG